MKFKGMYTAMTALSLIAAPTMAVAAPVATPLTQTAPEAVKGDNALAGSGAGFLIGLLALAAIVGGIIAATSHHSRPNSP